MPARRRILDGAIIDNAQIFNNKLRECGGLLQQFSRSRAGRDAHPYAICLGRALSGALVNYNVKVCERTTTPP
jgi:hypothetical protein